MKYFKLKVFLSSWRKLTNSSINRKIFSVAVLVGILTLLVKLIALVKELVVAWSFGTNDSLDAFLIAYLVPAFVVNVVATPLNAAFMPTYIQVREQEGDSAAQKLFSGAIIGGLGLLGIITIVMVSTAPLYLPLIASGFRDEKLELTFHLLCVSAPIVLLNGVLTLLGAVLNAQERFALVALSPIITASISVLFLFLMRSWGIFALPAGIVCGGILEIVLLGVALHRQGFSLRLRWYGFDTHLCQVAGQYVPMIAAAFLMCSSTPVDQSMAAMLLPGSVAALNYGFRVSLSILSLMSTALNTAVIPYFSKMLASNDWAGIQNTFNRYIQLICIITIPLTGVLVVWSEPIIQTLFQRGSFTAQDTHLVAQIQALYALAIPFYLGDILVVSLIKSLRLSQVLIWVCGMNLLLNITFNYILIQWMGVKGIALSTSCVYLFSFSCVFFLVKKRLKKNYVTAISKD